VVDIVEENNLQNMVNRSFKDPLAALLLKNSNLTTVQYECLVIDYLVENITDNSLTYDNKALFRSKKVSRGSFSRTLSQARSNIISSIYTILLLSYIGVFDTEPFDDYRNLSEKLSEYLSIIDNLDQVQSRQFIRRIERELQEGIRALAVAGKLRKV
jgi:hypothetical protein